jgi:hypothetical protein
LRNQVLSLYRIRFFNFNNFEGVPEMVANCDRTCPLSRRMLIAASALTLGFSLSAAAQTASTPDNSASAPAYSSSDLRAYLNSDGLLGGGGSYSAAPSGNAAASASPQYGGKQQSAQYPGYESRFSHIAIEAGVGFTIPVGNDTNFSQNAVNAGYLSPDESVGYGFNVGGGWNFSKHIATLLEFSFQRMGMPGNYLTALSNASGVTASGSSLGGNINTWSLTLDPVYYMPFSHKSGAYVTGGGGFYRKVTNFTEPVENCGYSLYGYICDQAPETVEHFSSNQGGLNIGLGLYRKLFGEDSNAKFFAEARYVWVDSPKASTSNGFQGSGTEGLLPIAFGIRF